MEIIEKWESKRGKFWAQIEKTIVQVRQSEHNTQNVPVYAVRYDNGCSSGLTLDQANKELLKQVSYCSSKMYKVGV